MRITIDRGRLAHRRKLSLDNGFADSNSDAAFFGIVGFMVSGVVTTAVALGRPWKIVSFISRAMKFSSRLHAQRGSAES